MGSSGLVPFQAHIDLLGFFLDHRRHIVEGIEGVLNARRKPAEYLQDASLLGDHIEDCFFTLTGVAPSQSRLRGQLEDAQRADGFRPRAMPGVHNGLIDPAEIMTRAFYMWQQTRWPGRSGRIRYAHTLFNLYIIRSLELLSLRLWDSGASGAGDRLSQLQSVLDRLRATGPDDQPALVRDARWLIQMAQSPATDDLAPYFAAAAKISESLPDGDRIAIHKAGVRMAGGHLRSQTRHFALKKGVPFDDTSLVVLTRTSNALDYALLVQDLVPLLEAYERAWHGGDRETRLDLADAICQGFSPDPELFVNRVELLGAYSMIEHLFVTARGDGNAVHTPTGRRHVRLLREYQALIGRLAKPLHEDSPHFRPVAGAYSPYGLIYGFSSHLLEHMALKATQADAVTHFGLEDVFVAGDSGKLAWVSGWRKLPHLTREVEQMFDYPQQFAEDVFDRLANALQRRASGHGAADVRTGRLIIAPPDDGEPAPLAPSIPDLPVRYIASSDKELVAARRAELCDEPRLLSDRREGRCVVSYQTAGGWVAITKAVLTEILGAGRDAKIAGLPPAAAGVLQLMCPELVARPEELPAGD